MRRPGLTLAALLLAGHGALAQAPDAAGRRALVIGNSAYTALPGLPGCAASARTVSAALRRRGFAVTEMTDVSNGEMGSAIRGLAAPGGTAVVLYVCGYAVDFGGRDFLLPATAALQRDTDAITQGALAKSALGAVRDAGVPGLVLLDLVAAPPPGAAGEAGGGVGGGAGGGSPGGQDGAAPPANHAVLHPEALAAPPVPAGLVVSVSQTAPPDGASAFAAAIAGALAATDLPVAEVAAGIVQKASVPGVKVTLGLPAAPGDLLAPPAAATPAATPASAAGAPAATLAASAAPPDEAHMTEADRRRVQAALLRLGYYDRDADGIFGAETRAAIRRFQHEIGAAMTGVITPAQQARLLAGKG